MGKEVGEASEGTCVEDPWAWTTGWGLNVGVGVSGGRCKGE